MYFFLQNVPNLIFFLIFLIFQNFKIFKMFNILQKATNRTRGPSTNNDSCLVNNEGP